MSDNGKHPEESKKGSPTALRTEEFKRLKEAIGAMPEVRIDRVNELREAIFNGTYSVDSYAVAEKIVQEIRFEIPLGRNNGSRRKQ